MRAIRSARLARLPLLDGLRRLDLPLADVLVEVFEARDFEVDVLLVLDFAFALAALVFVFAEALVLPFDVFFLLDG